MHLLSCLPRQHCKGTQGMPPPPRLNCRLCKHDASSCQSIKLAPSMFAKHMQCHAKVHCRRKVRCFLVHTKDDSSSVSVKCLRHWHCPGHCWPQARSAVKGNQRAYSPRSPTNHVFFRLQSDLAALASLEKRLEGQQNLLLSSWTPVNLGRMAGLLFEHQQRFQQMNPGLEVGQIASLRAALGFAC